MENKRKLNKKQITKQDDKTPLTYAQIQEKIKEYKINQRGINLINYGLNINAQWTDAKLKDIAKDHYMTKELLDEKIKKYKISPEIVDIIYSLHRLGYSYDTLGDDYMLESLGKDGFKGEGNFMLRCMGEAF
jgi:hypothetical protein